MVCANVHQESSFTPCFKLESFWYTLYYYTWHNNHKCKTWYARFAVLLHKPAQNFVLKSHRKNEKHFTLDNGVFPSESLAFTFTPWLARKSTTSSKPLAHARCRADLNKQKVYKYIQSNGADTKKDKTSWNTKIPTFLKPFYYFLEIFN